ncbi:MAG TPA: DUF2007 domain-containing protein [Longimicrobium sp.]|nr:DUF2007 domain-containing protein [Longimicrobium sp.]
MKYCTKCGSEYVDSVERCVDCQGATLVAAAQVTASAGVSRGGGGDMDTRRFTRAGTAEDPLSAEQLATAVRGAGIPVFSRQRMGGTVDSITGGNAPWWEILVPEDSAERAMEIIERERASLRATEDEAARAAEEEEAEGELVTASVGLEPTGAKPG